MSDWSEYNLTYDDDGKMIEVELFNGPTIIGQYNVEWEWDGEEENAYATVTTEDGEEYGCADWRVVRWRLAKESKQ